MTRPRRLAAPLVGAALTLLLAACVATGPQPQDAIPPALLGSDLGILEADAGKSVDGASVDVWASFVVERDEVSADDLREVLRLVVENTHITNIAGVSIIGQSDEVDPDSPIGANVYLDLVPAADALGLDDADDGLGTIRVDWDDVVRMLEETP